VFTGAFFDLFALQCGERLLTKGIEQFSLILVILPVDIVVRFSIES
jgi:hypothetical protein